MRKFLFLIMLTIAFSGLSQETLDVITLNNGSVIIGKITEFNFKENLTVQTKDGYGFMFNVEDIKSIKKEQPEEKFKIVVPTPVNQHGIANAQASNYANTVAALPPQSITNAGNVTSGQNYQRTYPNQNMQHNNPYATDPSKNYNNQQGYNPQNSQQFQDYQNSQQPIHNQYAITEQNNQNLNPQPNNNYYRSNPIASVVLPSKPVTDPNIFTNIDSYGSMKAKSPTIDCSLGFGNFYFANKTNKNILVSIQKKQKDGYYSDYRELTIPNNSRGLFKDLRTGEYPFFVKVKNSIGNNQNEYKVLGRGSISVEKCKTQQMDIN